MATKNLWQGLMISMTLIGLPVIAGAQQQTVNFRCDAAANQTCYFSLLPQGGGISNFTLRGGGQTHAQSGMWPGRDRYIVTIDRPTLGSWDRCVRQEGGWCKAAVIQAGWNN